MLARPIKHLGINSLKALHLLPQLGNLLGQTGSFTFKRRGWLLAVGAIQLSQVTRNAFLDLRHATLHLGSGEVAIPIVNGLELAAVYRDTGIRKQANRAAQLHEPGTDLADRRAVVLAEVGNRLVVGSQTTAQPHHFHVAARFAFQTAARLNLVEVTVNIKLQQNRWVITRPASCQGFNSAKAQATQIKLINKHIDHANGIVLANIIVQSFGEQSALAAVFSLNKTLHKDLPLKLWENHIMHPVFTQPGSKPVLIASPK